MSTPEPIKGNQYYKGVQFFAQQIQQGTINFLKSVNAVISGTLCVGTKLATTSSIVDIYSKTKGILFPRMTTVEKNRIVNPANGLIVYDTTRSLISFRNTTEWVDIEPGSSMGSWSDEVPITIIGGRTPPTKGNTVTDYIIYRKISDDNEYEILCKYTQASPGSNGSGGYIFSLPGGLRFSSTKGQQFYVNIPIFGLPEPYQYILTRSSGHCNLSDSSNDIVIIPYDSHRFRLFTTNSGTAPLTFIGTTTYGLGNSHVPLTYMFSFTFFAE